VIVATISSTATRAALAASRARIVATADETRRRIERDLHDGTQQRLVTLALELAAAKHAVPSQRQDLLARLSRIEDGLIAALEELREISRGVHPAVLSEAGSAPRSSRSSGALPCRWNSSWTAWTDCQSPWS
jgi:signal transduction histidine kinase